MVEQFGELGRRKNHILFGAKSNVLNVIILHDTRRNILCLLYTSTGDATNALTPAGRTKIQNECYDFYKTILNWRKGNDVIAKEMCIRDRCRTGERCWRFPALPADKFHLRIR